MSEINPARRDLLQAFVKESTDPIIWGVDDCSAWAAQWIKRVRPDIVLDLPHYGSRDEALVIIQKAGGLVALWSDIALRAGIPKTYDAGYGDVGIMRLGTRDIGVIFAAGGVALWRNAQGGVVSIRPPRVMQAWAI